MYPKGPLRGLFGPEKAFSAHNECSQNAATSSGTEEYFFLKHNITRGARSFVQPTSSDAHIPGPVRTGQGTPTGRERRVARASY